MTEPLKLTWRVVKTLRDGSPSSQALVYGETRAEVVPYLDECHALGRGAVLQRLDVQPLSGATWVEDDPFTEDELGELKALHDYAKTERKLDGAQHTNVTLPLALFGRLCLRAGGVRGP